MRLIIYHIKYTWFIIFLHFSTSDIFCDKPRVSMFRSIDCKRMVSREATRSEFNRFSFARGTRVSCCQGSQLFHTYASTAVDEVLFVCAKDRLADFSAVTKTNSRWQQVPGLITRRDKTTNVILSIYVVI